MGHESASLGGRVHLVLCLESLGCLVSISCVWCLVSISSHLIWYLVLSLSHRRLQMSSVCLKWRQSAPCLRDKEAMYQVFHQANGISLIAERASRKGLLQQALPKSDVCRLQMWPFLFELSTERILSGWGWGGWWKCCRWWQCWWHQVSQTWKTTNTASPSLGLIFHRRRFPNILSWLDHDQIKIVMSEQFYTLTMFLMMVSWSSRIEIVTKFRCEPRVFLFMLMEEKQDGRQVKWPHVWERFKVGQSLNLSYRL